MDENKPKSDPNANGEQPQRGFNPRVLFFLLMMAVVLLMFANAAAPPPKTYNKFKDALKEGRIESIEIQQQVAICTYKKELQPNGEPAKFSVQLPPSPESVDKLDKELAEYPDLQVTYLPPDTTMSTLMLIAILLPIGMLLFFWISYRRSRDQFMGGGFLSGFGKTGAKRYDQEEAPITFKDVAGQKAAKQDLQEIVEFLKEPTKFQKLGGRIPKGVLLNGPPGTGKTLLARAVAGEAGVPFYSVNGSEFIQMFVGVGASRVRDLFQKAKETAPAIIFIDEIDAVGRQRGAGLGGGHDEREQTLNQILSEMDGFDQSDSTIVVAATNRPDVLDPALLRPGRFDRHVTVGRPTQKGRRDIFKVHVRNVPLDDDVDLEILASGTVGLTGADIRNIVNESALWAARQDKNFVSMADFDHARDKILMGARREEVMSEDDKNKTAYHEAGHTIASWFLPGADRVHKVTIIPRGRSLGSTQMLPEEDRVSMSEPQLLDQLVVFLAGRAAEILFYDEIAVGAENDLERATSIARRMVMNWGMSERLGPVSYKVGEDDPFLGREMHEQRKFSEHTAEVIDEEVERILHHAAERALQTLKQYKSETEALTAALMEHEELSELEIEALIGESVHGPAGSTSFTENPSATETKGSPVQTEPIAPSITVTQASEQNTESAAAESSAPEDE